LNEKGLRARENVRQSDTRYTRDSVGSWRMKTVVKYKW